MGVLKIAIADDEPTVRTLLATWLTRMGHVVVAVEDGEELLEVCRGGGIDLVVSDVQMPRVSGLAAAARLRHECGVPVILVSASWSNEQTAEARAAGAFLLSKPVPPLTLLAMVEEVGRRRAAATV